MTICSKDNHCNSLWANRKNGVGCAIFSFSDIIIEESMFEYVIHLDFQTLKSHGFFFSWVKKQFYWLRGE